MAFTMPKDTNPFSLGALAGAVLVAWVGFDGLGWKTSSATESLVRRGAETAVIAAHARICSTQFGATKDVSARRAELEKTDRYARGDLLAKAGFATMSGEKEPTSGVAQACADLILPG